LSEIVSTKVCILDHQWKLVIKYSLPAHVEVNYRLANQSDYYSSNLRTLVLVSVCEVVSRDGTTIGDVIDVVAMVMEKL